LILSDRSIREAVEAGRLRIEPYDPALIQPSSIDLRLARSFLLFHTTKHPYLDVRQPAEDLMERVTVEDDEPIIIQSGAFLLGSTLEQVSVPDDVVGRLEGRSSLGRIGIVIHSTAVFIDAGFSGHITLEISNLASIPVALYPGMRIAQLSFIQMTTPAERPYGTRDLGSKYLGLAEPTPSRLYLDFQKER
jgi:dCTP deaminase